MVDDNAINPETGETIYVGIFESLPDGYWWISDMDKEDWLKLVRHLIKRVPDGAVCPAHQTYFEADGTCAITGCKETRPAGKA